MTFSPDGKRIASGSWDNTIGLWRAAQTDELKIPGGQFDFIDDFEFSRDSRKLLSIDFEHGSTVVHEVATGLSVRVNHREFSRGNTPSLKPRNTSPDGRWLAFPVVRRMYLVELSVQQTPSEKRRRELLARLRPDQHQQQANSCEEKGNLYGAVFHRACLVVNNPADSAAVDLFLAAHQKWHDGNRSNHLPVSPVVTQALVIANGEIPH